MKKIIFYILLCVSCFTGNAQTTFKYYNPEHFKGYSVVFTKEYKSHFYMKDLKSQFTPTKEEIDSAEAIFMRRYDVDINQKEAYIETSNPVKFYWYYKRQYMGVIGSNGDKLILIQILNARKRKYIEDYYENWETEFTVGTGGFYDKSTMVFLINLTAGEMKAY